MLAERRLVCSGSHRLAKAKNLTDKSQIGHLNLKSTIKTGLSYLFDLLTVVFSLLLAVSCNIYLFVLSSF